MWINPSSATLSATPARKLATLITSAADELDRIIDAPGPTAAATDQLDQLARDQAAGRARRIVHVNGTKL